MNRITAGQAKIGAATLTSLTVNSSATIAASNITTLYIGGTQLTATAAEANAVLDLSVTGGVRKIKKITITGSAVGSSEMDSGWALPAPCEVNDVKLHIITASTAGGHTCSVGLLATTSGDADGFLATVGTTSTGLKYGSISASTSGYTVSNWGVLLGANTTVDTTGIQLARHLTCILNSDTSSRDISYTMSTTANDSFVANILVDYTEFSS
jgi:hypothetical protein